MNHPTEKQIKFLNQKLQVLDEEKCLLQGRIEDYAKQVEQDTRLWIQGHQEKDLSYIRSMIDTATVKLVDTYDVFAVEKGHAPAQFTEKDNTVQSDVPKTGLPASNETKDTTSITPELRNEIENILSKFNNENMEVLSCLKNQLEELTKCETNNSKLIKKHKKKLQHNINLLLEKEKKLETEIEILKENVQPLQEQVDSIQSKMKGLTMLERKMNSNEDMLKSLSLEVKSFNMETNALKLDLCKERDRISDLHQSTNTYFSRADTSYAQCEKNFKVVYTLLSSHLVKLEQSKDLFLAGLEKRKENLMQFETMKENLCKLQWKTISLNIQIDVILAGDDGVGKTSTGNSIVGRSRFGISQITDQAQISEVFSTEINNVKLTVTDPLPISYQHSIMRTAGPQIKRSYDTLLRVSKGDKFHVLIYVVRFGSENEATLYEEIKKNYKGKLFHNHCVIVMCGGDDFYKKNPSLSFENWCERQTGRFANMYTDCNKKAVLFDNATDTAGNMMEQRTKLLKAILQLPSQGNTFKIVNTDGPFSKCAQQ